MVVALAGVTWLAEASSPAVARTAAIAIARSLAGCARRVMFMGVPCLPRYGSVGVRPLGGQGQTVRECASDVTELARGAPSRSRPRLPVAPRCPAPRRRRRLFRQRVGELAP